MTKLMPILLLLVLLLLAMCVRLAPCESGFTQVRDYCVANDYYKVDGVRTPLTWKETEELLKETGMELPTKELVDDIWFAATLQHEPQPMKYPGNYVIHDKIIDHEGRLNSSYTSRDLQAGHKKDVIGAKGNGVCIYGWHRNNGKPIQPLNCKSHDLNYKDYSHGIRLVYPIRGLGNV